MFLELTSYFSIYFKLESSVVIPKINFIISVVFILIKHKSRKGKPIVIRHLLIPYIHRSNISL